MCFTQRNKKTLSFFLALLIFLSGFITPIRSIKSSDANPAVLTLGHYLIGGGLLVGGGLTFTSSNDLKYAVHELSKNWSGFNDYVASSILNIASNSGTYLYRVSDSAWSDVKNFISSNFVFGNNDIEHSYEVSEPSQANSYAFKSGEYVHWNQVKSNSPDYNVFVYYCNTYPGGLNIILNKGKSPYLHRYDDSTHYEYRLVYDSYYSGLTSTKLFITGLLTQPSTYTMYHKYNSTIVGNPPLNNPNWDFPLRRNTDDGLGPRQIGFPIPPGLNDNWDSVADEVINPVLDNLLKDKTYQDVDKSDIPIEWDAPVNPPYDPPYIPPVIRPWDGITDFPWSGTGTTTSTSTTTNPDGSISTTTTSSITTTTSTWPEAITDIITDSKVNPETGEREKVSLNLNPLIIAGSLLTEKFPFSLPWDIKRAFESLGQGTNTSPKFDIPIYKHYKISIDLTLWDNLASIIRTINVFLFNLGLVLITRKIIGGDV